MENNEFVNKMKVRLEQEEASLELELTDAGRLYNADSGNWEGNAGEYDTGDADKNVLADKMEEVLTNDAIVDELEVRLVNVKDALKRIKDGTYGFCANCKKEIEKERLEANPAARLCIECEE